MLVGTSGLLSPFAKIDGLYFNPEDEAYDFYYKLMHDIKELNEDSKIHYITMDYENPKDFYDALKAMQDFTKDNIKVYGTSRADKYEFVINEDSDMDDTTKPSTVALAKKKKKKPDNKE